MSSWYAKLAKNGIDAKQAEKARPGEIRALELQIRMLKDKKEFIPKQIELLQREKAELPRQILALERQLDYLRSNSR
jgi:hypothetical protein